METLPLTCDCGCNETEKRNVIKEDIDGEMFEVEWSEYCKKCGKYLGYFSYGHWEYQNYKSYELTRKALNEAQDMIKVAYEVENSN